MRACLPLETAVAAAYEEQGGTRHSRRLWFADYLE